MLEEDPGRYYLENTPRGFPVTPYRPIEQVLRDLKPIVGVADAQRA